MPVPLSLLALVTLSLQAPPRTPAGAPAPRPDPGRPVLTINGEPTSASEFEAWLIPQRGEVLASTFATEWVLEREAARLSISVTPETVWAAVEALISERMQGSFRGSRQGWLRSIERLGRTEAGYLAQSYVEQRTELLAKALTAVDRVVPEEKILRDWEQSFGPGGVRLAVRIIELPFHAPPVPPDASEEQSLAAHEAAREALRQEAAALRGKIVAGELGFGDAARQHSKDPESAASAGLPRGGFRRETWPAHVNEALDLLQPGEVSAPLFARESWFLFELVERSVTPLADVHGDIEAALIASGPESDEVAARVQALRDSVTVEVQPAMWSAPEPGTSLRPDEEVVLVIDGVPVSRREYTRWVVHLNGENMAYRFAEYWMVERAATAAGHTVDPEVVEARVRDDVERAIRYEYKGKREKWEYSVTGEGRTLEGWEREARLRTRKNLLAEALLIAQREVRPEEVRDEWREHYGAEGKRVEASVLRLDVPLDAQGRHGDEARALTLERMAAIRRRAVAGEAFAELVRAESMDTETAADGGRMPDGFRPDRWPAHVGEAVLALGPGGISDPLQSGSSWFLFQLHEVREVPFESVEQELRNELAGRRPSDVELAGFVNVMTRDAEIKVLPALFD